MDLVRKPREIQKLLDTVKTQYRGFISIQNRVNSKEGRHVVAIQPDKFEEFLRALIDDSDISKEKKVLIAIALSTGHRVSEILSLQRCSFRMQNGKLYLITRVLKKKQRTERNSVIHPTITDFVWRYVSEFPAFAKIFSIDRHQALYAVKVGLGEAFDTHAFRHSLITYLLKKKNLSTRQVADLMKISERIVAIYAHPDASELLEGLFEVA